MPGAYVRECVMRTGGPRLVVCSLVCVLAASGPVPAGLTLVQDGRALARIVTGPEPNTIERLAAEELQWHIREMSGASLEIADMPADGVVSVYLGRAATAVQVTAEVTDPLDVKSVQPGTLFAVYHLLDRVWGVRWLWPGADGTLVPKRSTVVVPDLTVTDGPRLIQRQMRSLRSRRMRARALRSGDGVTLTPDEIADRLDREERLWLRRHRMGRRQQLAFGHGYTHWWAKYGKTHPEYFATLHGRVQPYPHADRVKLCVSNPAVVEQIVADWQAAGADGHVRGCPNDSRHYCTCAHCRTWDLPVVTTPETVDASVLTYRYCRLWTVLAEKVAAINPNVFVCGYAYSNYRQPPEGIRLPPNLILGYVGGMDESAQQEWEKWSVAGVKLFFRPNWFHSGHNAFFLPLHQAGRFLKFAAANSMLGTDFDSLVGHYSTQGVYYYLVARLHARPDLSVDDIIREYCSAFGAAAAEIQEYLTCWEEFTPRFQEEALKAAELYRSGSRAYLRLLPAVFTDEVLAPAEQLLARAAERVAGLAVETRRVHFLQQGLRHVRLTRDAVRYGNDVGSVRGIRENALHAVAAARRLREFRESIQDTFIDWPEYCDSKEIGLGDYTGLRLAAALGARHPVAVLPAAWFFRFDPQDVGETEGWFRLDHDPRRAKWEQTQVYRWWEQNDVGRKWREEHGQDFDGVAWYRTRFTVPEVPEGKRAKLLFGAVDEACKVWLNGELVGEHPFVEPDDWKTPFEFDITGKTQVGTNEVAVRVVDNAGMGGIWKLVWLLAE